VGGGGVGARGGLPSSSCGCELGGGKGRPGGDAWARAAGCRRPAGGSPASGWCVRMASSDRRSDSAASSYLPSTYCSDAAAGAPHHRLSLGQSRAGSLALGGHACSARPSSPTRLFSVCWRQQHAVWPPQAADSGPNHPLPVQRAAAAATHLQRAALVHQQCDVLSPAARRHVQLRILQAGSQGGQRAADSVAGHLTLDSAGQLGRLEGGQKARRQTARLATGGSLLPAGGPPVRTVPLQLPAGRLPTPT
jgi:hypothetical protein